VNDPGWVEYEETWLLFDGCPIHELLADYYNAKKDLDIVAHVKKGGGDNEGNDNGAGNATSDD